MKQPTKYFVIGVFLLLNITDIITTILAGSKHGFKYEGNLFYQMTKSLTLTFILKWIIVFLIIAVFLYFYDKRRTIVRYVIFLMISMMIVTLFVVTVNNYLIYKQPTGEYEAGIEKRFGEEISREEIKEYQKERFTDPLTSLFAFCIITFMFFNWIENERKTPKTS